MKRIFSISLTLLMVACSSHLPAPGRSVVTGGYSQMADTNAATATLTVETAEPVTLLTLGALGDAAQIYCVASFTQMDWAQNSRAAIQNGDGATIARYASLHVIPNEVKVDGDHVGPADNDEPFAIAYTDDGHEGAICRFELNKLRVVASQ